MNQTSNGVYFLLILLAGIFILVFFILKPFLFALILAIVFATVFEPLHKKALVMTRGKEGLAALIATVSVLLVVVAPLAFLGIQIFQEATQLYSSIDMEDVVQNLKRFFPVPIEFSIDINQYTKQGLNWLLQHLGPLFSNVAKIMVSVFVFLVALYY
ncbi:MAG: AI-2E family transporter, partial [Minisyncoccia bacterium]